MGKDKARPARTKTLERKAPTVRSITRTLTGHATAIGLGVTICLGAMIGLGTLAVCAGDQGGDQNATGESQTEHGGAENTESGSDDGEESGESLALDETYDFVRKGARLILRYDAENNAFMGTVRNTTESALNSVRVEVHLSNGTELGPTTPVDLAPGQLVEVSLAATEEPFTGWTPHAEVGTGEHGSGTEGGESDGEHGEGSEGGEDGVEHGGGGEGGEGEGEHGEGNVGGEGGGEHGGGGEGGEGGSEHGSRE